LGELITYTRRPTIVLVVVLIFHVVFDFVDFAVATAAAAFVLNPVFFVALVLIRGCFTATLGLMTPRIARGRRSQLCGRLFLGCR
jgi:hypothetical protein